ncbi:MAG: helix-hairpin-helix domain-containing protein [Melioribacteraceae bacterium]|nr:helix-hairpin-helix domain-containing protein [Melioribacteraceae bacterium]
MEFNEQLIDALESYADLMEFDGENRFKISGFRSGARALSQIPDIENRIDDESIMEVKGIGKGIYSVIKEFYENGYIQDFEKIKSKYPTTLFELLSIKGVGAKKVKAIYDHFQLSGLSELEKICRENRLTEVKGFTKKSEENILEQIERIKSNKGFILINHADVIVKEVLDKLLKIDGVKKCSMTGDFRRGKTTYDKLEFVVSFNNDKISDGFLALDEIKKNGNQYELNSYTVPVIIFIALIKDYEKKLFSTTGSEELLKAVNNDLIESADSEEKILGIKYKQFFTAEFREIENINREVPYKEIIEEKDYKGLIHFHTTYSDGLNSIEEMVQFGLDNNIEYFVVSDHSKSAFYANGLQEDRIIKQREEIFSLRKSITENIFHGIESDILKDGSLDYDLEILKGFDFVIASIHSVFNLDEDVMTRRIIKAVENPYTRLLAHPTGRILLNREGYKVNLKKVIDACVANNVAIELNSTPSRLDLDWKELYYAMDKECYLAIDPDAHRKEGILSYKYGIKMAQKVGYPKELVINTFDVNRFKKYLSDK